MGKHHKRGRNPVVYDCANPSCTRERITIQHNQIPPGADVEPERIHHVLEPEMFGFVIMCSACGHYTIVSRFPKSGTT